MQPAMDSNSRNITDGGPSEDRGKIRKGQIDWIPPIAKATDFKLWLFKFKTPADIYLSKTVYPDAEERRGAYLNALLIAATKGEFEDMCRMLELLNSSNVTCEELLKKLEAYFLPSIDQERRQVTAKFEEFKRGQKTLKTALKELQLIIMECRKAGYTPDEQTARSKYERLLTSPSEWQAYRMQLKQAAEEVTESPLKATIRIIEELAHDLDLFQPEEAGNVDFGGGAFRNGARGVRRNGIEKAKPKQQAAGQTSQKQTSSKKSGPSKEHPHNKKCTYCGKACPSAKGEGKEKCPAFSKQCSRCGMNDHFAIVCRNKVKDGKAGAAVTASQSMTGF